MVVAWVLFTLQVPNSSGNVDTVKLWNMVPYVNHIWKEITEIICNLFETMTRYRFLMGSWLRVGASILVWDTSNKTKREDWCTRFWVLQIPRCWISLGQGNYSQLGPFNCSLGSCNADIDEIYSRGAYSWSRPHRQSIGYQNCD